ncbi:hypothetical protein SKAU_G00378570 [Synaphobranchus kaupii]|uniref:SH3 domain-containing protein n=1 Tax=Synaphobranchus kaupii TaxID=118154 RepID=A0A9Q1ED67_SYNKA|nr:hypothetical protein SKAU_G00378570 [Synaphobranchus kaupii]
MADGEGRCELSIAPGQMYIEVEYDYEYQAKDRLITIREGDCYILVRKTNEDWWQVRKDESSKGFYVPAQYVREVRKALMPPPKPLHTGRALKPRPKPNFLDIRRSDENLSRHLEMSSFGRPSPSPSPVTPGPGDPNQNPDSPDDRCQDNNNAWPLLPPARADSPEPRSPDPPHRLGRGQLGKAPERLGVRGRAEQQLRRAPAGPLCLHATALLS